MHDLKIVELYKNGLSTRKIAEETGISNTQIRRILNKNNVEMRSLKTDSKIEKNVISRYKIGESSEKIAKDLKINGSTVCRILKRNNVKIRSSEENKRKYEIIADFFNTIDSEEKAYFLGFLYADGNVSSTCGHICLNLHKQDLSILEHFGNLIYKNKDYCITSYKDYRSISVYSKKMKNDLILHGCTPRKSFTLTIPDISDHLMKHFIRGLFDGDGCYYYSEDGYSTVSLIGSNTFIKEIYNYLLKKLGIVGSISSSKGSKKISNIYYRKKINVVKLINYLYSDSKLFLDRKKEKAFKIINGISNDKPLHYSTENIVKYKGNRLTKKYILSLSKKDKKETADFVFDYFRANGFPFPKYSDEVILKEFEKLKSYKLDSDICPKSLVGQKIIYNFCEHFFSVKSTSQLSMLDAFNNDECLMSTIYNRMGISYKETFSITGNMIRQGLRNSYNAFGVSFFKPIVAKFIYNKYAPENASVLDISAGFGQRMLGACASKKVSSYIGLDPWKETCIAINNMIDFFNFQNTNIINIGSEKFKKNIKFDFCFSSPPFFNKEIYSDDKTQAANNRSLEDFIRDWWMITAQNVHSMLKDNSLFVMNMDKKIASLMISRSKHLFKFVDKYEISYQRAHKGSSGIEAFFILKKV